LIVALFPYLWIMEFLIFLTMMAFPLFVALLDKQVKKHKGEPQVKAHPLFPSAEEDTQEAPADPGPRPDNAPEGQRAITRTKRESPAVPTESALQTNDPEPKLRIDKKNLILYSEILKPKFDD